MRKVISAIGILSIVAASLLSSCATKKDIEGLQGQLDELKSDRIASIESQIKSISGSITKLESVDTELRGYITTLQTKQQELIQKDADLAKTISDLKVEVYGKISDEKTAILLQLSNDKQELLGKITSAETRLSQLEGKASSLESKDADLQKQIDDAKSEISSLKTKCDNLSKQITDLETTLRSEISSAQAEVLSQLDSYKKTVEGELLSMSSSIGSLQAKDIELEGKISNLNNYVDNQISGARDWVRTTFATLEQYESVCGEVASVKAQIQTINANIASLSKTVSDNKTDLLNLYNSLKTQVGTDIQNAVESCNQAIASAKTELTTAYTQAITTAISTLETSMKGWVNDQLTGYYTIAQMDAKLKLLSDADASMQSSISKLESDLNTAKTELTEAYTKAITDAINTYNGEITAQIAADIKTTTDALQKQIDNLQAQIDALTDRVSALEEQIQSVTIIPAYSDGSVVASADYILSFCCVVSPNSIVRDLSISDISIIVTDVKTKAAPFIILDATSVEKDESIGLLRVYADISSFYPIASGRQLSVALRIRYGKSDYTSLFVNVTTENFVDLGLPSGKLWAICNIGAVSPEDNGFYFTWGNPTGYIPTNLTASSYSNIQDCDWVVAPGYNLSGTVLTTGFSEAFYNTTFGKTLRNDLPSWNDMATLSWGDDWRMPTEEDYKELVKYTVVSKVDNYKGSGVSGVLFSSKIAGYTDKSIFFPFSGYGYNSSVYNMGTQFYCWSSSFKITTDGRSHAVSFSSYIVGYVTSNMTYLAFPIRPVRK